MAKGIARRPTPRALPAASLAVQISVGMHPSAASPQKLPTLIGGPRPSKIAAHLPSEPLLDVDTNRHPRDHEHGDRRRMSHREVPALATKGETPL